jgi:hypothetical protein
VCIRHKCTTRGDEEYYLGLKVHKISFLGVLRVHYDGLRSMMLKIVDTERGGGGGGGESISIKIYHLLKTLNF